jgi:tRNA-splicing ligase RtcB (3'-phosphate/5'-hydroxy nucleic acid ligase)
MKEKKLAQWGVPQGAAMRLALASCAAAARDGMPRREIEKSLRVVLRNPALHTGHAQFGELAQVLSGMESAGLPVSAVEGQGAPWKQWGRDLDPKSIDQMRNACSLPISVRGALMPDAHVGYGLPIGGVLATRNAVIPYAVGVDIACRMKMTVIDWPVEAIEHRLDRLRGAIERETRFGVGSEFQQRRSHAVMDRDWKVSPITREHKDKAWAQLGTSGSGNHFVEFGVLEIAGTGLGLEAGTYLALLSHSGSRGTGALVCDYYSKLAMRRHPHLPGHLRHLAWLDLESEEGGEYWAAMQLMGAYAAANHALIHRHIARNLGAQVLLDIENHHNFAWKEHHYDEELIVHRKGATPASDGTIGIIPGSMATPAYIVRGRGQPESLESAAHGAGRVMSRAQAKKTFRWKEAQAFLDARRVTLLSAGLDEVPMVYKDIDAVMAAQLDLVEILARFQPRLVKMADGGERPDD